MDETDNKIGKKHNLLNGIVYTGIAGLIGVGAYLIAKYKHLGGRASYTMAGLILLVSAPRIIDAGKTYLTERNKLAELEIYNAAKKDSIDAVLRLNAPKDTSTLDISDLIHKTMETSKAMEEKYQNITSNNSKILEAMLEKKNEQYIAAVNVLRENTEKLQNTIEELQNVRTVVVPVDNSSNIVSKQSNTSTSNSRNYFSANNAASINSSVNLERITSQNTSSSAGVSENLVSSYYLIDADKSNGEIQVYGVYTDGSKKYLSIVSKASFAMNGGPANGNYVLRNKGARDGALYPGFLEMNDPIGISGAGEYNQYLDDIQNGALANKTGIRVPNEVYAKIARLVDEKKTVINVHE
jgi:hypothetical protein